MRIGLDFDDTLADFGELLAVAAMERWGIDLRAAQAAGQKYSDVVGQERFSTLVREALTTDLTLEMTPVPGALEGARRLSEHHDIVVVTARNDQESGAAIRWLERYAIRVSDFIATNRGSKAVPARERGLRLLMDDSAHNFADFQEDHPTVPALLLHGVWGDRDAHPRVHRIEHWRHFEALVQRVEQEDAAAK